VALHLCLCLCLLPLLHFSHASFDLPLSLSISLFSPLSLLSSLSLPGNEVLKSVVAQYNAEELLSKRAEISQQIRAALIKRATAFDLILDDVSITHLTFGREFAKAIEQKQVAQQQAERQTWVVARSDQERKAAVIRAEGEAEVRLPSGLRTTPHHTTPVT
jgi:uncharacterized protein YqfA (UPF0365 family)